MKVSTVEIFIVPVRPYYWTVIRFPVNCFPSVFRFLPHHTNLRPLMASGNFIQYRHVNFITCFP